MEFEIRSATSSDVDSLLSLQQRVHPWAWERRAWCEELGRRQSIVWIVDGGGGEADALGFLVAWRVLDAIEIVDLGVAPEARRHQIATALMQTLVALAATSAVARIALQVRPKNRGAIALYKKLGFHFVGRQSGYYEDGDSARLMERSVDMS